MIHRHSSVHQLPVIGLILGVLLLGSGALIASEPAASPSPTAVPGGIYRWPLPEGAADLRFNTRPVLTRGAEALVGLPLSQPLGPAEITYRLGDQTRSHVFEVSDKAYSEQHITLKNREMVNPNPEQLARIRRESSRQRALYLAFSDRTPPQNGFLRPLEGPVSSLFGHRRFFNGEPRNPHSGLDIAAPTGAEIRAPADAEVTLVDHLYYNGKTIFLDHGQGLITMYCHLSEPLVNEGETVQQGQVIGLVGATGRVTGPHLHWSVSLNGYRVDPQSMMSMLVPGDAD
ncbi:MAG: peptidoglycan DD-metalloendopeptidase family protein [Proteobacteria bacterium]|nr:peptidoglycan DD-metalloendopeptidase family protein [Pseudomonadota bacterium]